MTIWWMPEVAHSRSNEVEVTFAGPSPPAGPSIRPAISAALASVQNVREKVAIQWMSQRAAEVDCGEGYLYLDLPLSGPWIRQRLGSPRFCAERNGDEDDLLRSLANLKASVMGSVASTPTLGGPRSVQKSQGPLLCAARNEV